MKLVFDGCELDTERRTLALSGVEVDVEPRVFDVIAYLVEHGDRVVPKVELLDELWGDRFVSESALSTAIKQARRSLNDSGAEQRIIRTVHGRGFRVVVPVERAPRDPGEPGERGPARTAHPTGRERRIPRAVALVGRDAEVERLRSMIDPGSMVTVVGPGGVGKTSLTVAVAHDLVGPEHPVWFCDLIVQTDDTVTAAVLSAVDNTAGTGGATVHRIADRVGDGRATLVLDNCEHVLTGIRPLVAALRDLAPELSVVATSREVVGTLDERVVRLTGLPVDGPNSPAVQLFVRRGLEQGNLADTADNRLAAIRIADRLEGLPLALELAASRLASSTPHELLDALDDQLGILRTGDANDRHSTMERTVAWSYELLAEQQRRTLVHLSVFRAPFRLEAANHVVADPDLAHHLHRLVQCSMLSRSGDVDGSRFRMLEPIRQFVSRHLDDEVAAELAERHGEYFAARVGSLARVLDTSDEPIAAAALTAEWPDVAAAVRWGLEAGRADVAVAPLVALGFHIRWQQRTEAYAWLESALGRMELPYDLRKEALLVVALGAWTDGDLERLATLHDQARAIGPTGVRGALLDLFSDFYTDDPDRLIHRADELLAAAEDAGDAPWMEIGSAFRLTARAVARPDDPDTAAVAAELDRTFAGSPWPSGRSWRGLSQLTWAVRRQDIAAAEWYAAEIAENSAANGTPFFVQTAGPLLGGLQQSRDTTSRVVPGTARDVERLDRAAEAVRLVAETEERVNYSLAFRSAVISLHAAGHLATAARVSGFVGELEGGGRMLAVMTAEYDRVVDDLRRSLGPDEFAHLRQLGCRLDARSAADLVVACSSRARDTSPG